MRAWRVNRFGEPADVLELEDAVELPGPGPDQLRVRVEAAGLGLPDVLMCRNNYPLVPAPPFTPSQEAAGEVVAVGENVDAALIGTRVLGPTLFQAGRGGLAEESLLIAPMALPVPDDMSSEEAAGFFIPFQTAWVGLVQRARLTETDTLLVLGASGSSGSAAVQLAKALGARVIAVAGGPQNVAFCEELGADAVIDRHSEDITARVLELTDGNGVAVVYDPVGGRAGRAGFDAIGFEGRFVIIGYASGEWPPISLVETLPKNISLIGAMPVGYPPEFTRNSHRELVALWQQGKIRTRGVQVFSFDQGGEAIAAIAAGGTPGKVVVSLK